jgi:hypothetical protein
MVLQASETANSDIGLATGHKTDKNGGVIIATTRKWTKFGTSLSIGK